jgi:catechol 2,3-dioxygenase-like lactoylglutathione lyase family enzyme
MANVRYIVDDVDGAIAFYETLGFETVMHPAPEFAALQRDDLRLYINKPSGRGGAAQPMPDGRRPEPGGWNRIQLEVSDLDAIVGQLTGKGVQFRSEIISGIGGRQILADDPSGNPVELFEPAG